VRSRNIRTSTGEINLVIQYIPPDEPTISDEFGRYILVEYKTGVKVSERTKLGNSAASFEKSKLDWASSSLRKGLQAKAMAEMPSESSMTHSRKTESLL